MRILKLLFGLYQLLLSVLGLSFIVFSFIMVSRSNPDNVHWFVLICLLFTIGMGIGFCSLNGVRWIFGPRKMFEKFKGLAPVSIVFAVLMTGIVVLLAAETDWGAFCRSLVRHSQNRGSQLLGQNAPDFHAEDINGKPLHLLDFRGKYVLLDFWATWCGPCIAEIPNVQRLNEKYSKDKLIVIGISLDRDEQVLLSFLKKNNLSFLQILDKKKTISNKYNVTAIPMNFLIGPDGIIIAADLRGRQLLKLISNHIE